MNSLGPRNVLSHFSLQSVEIDFPDRLSLVTSGATGASRARFGLSPATKVKNAA
jgi:hypothetical protein